MKVTSSYVYVKNLRIHAYHGVLPHENIVGQDFIVSARCGVDISSSMENDMLEVALDYGVLYRLIEREMAQTSQLVEHVAGRIAHCVFDEFPNVTSLDLTITKLNPPFGADCEGAGVEIHVVRE
jgi:dihydroneopterin aldolase